jgi:hypothetical protein
MTPALFKIESMTIRTSQLLALLLVVGHAARGQSPDQCAVKSVQQIPTPFEAFLQSPTSNRWVATQYDANGVNQAYISTSINGSYNCITCAAIPGAPAVGLNKFMVNWHPSGQWLAAGVEEASYGWSWLPQVYKRGFLQSGVSMNLWITTPSGNRWYQMTDFSDAGPAYGFTGTPFTPDGKKAAAAILINGSSSSNPFGVWRLYSADFGVANGIPSLTNRTDITPAGAKWIEPGNFSPDGNHLLISTDIGLTDAEGQDQWSLDITTGALQQLTNTPAVWDEHGYYSPSGKKISFMSSYPYRSDPTSYKTLSLETEIMLMDADGGNLQQLTHFNAPGYPESQSNRTVAAAAWFIASSQLYAIVMGPNFISTSWMIAFAGACGS